MSDRAFRWIEKYVTEARPALLMASDDGTIFLEHGVAFDRLRLTTLVRGYIGKPKIGKTGVCHLFRHTVATLMLEERCGYQSDSGVAGGMRSFSTTELYTRVSINLLKAGLSGYASGGEREAGGTGGDAGGGGGGRRRMIEEGAMTVRENVHQVVDMLRRIVWTTCWITWQS